VFANVNLLLLHLSDLRETLYIYVICWRRAGRMCVFEKVFSFYLNILCLGMSCAYPSIIHKGAGILDVPSVTTLHFFFIQIFSRGGLMVLWFYPRAFLPKLKL